ncbi:MAG: hypothetical protein LBT10_01990 [Methanobrevibacter sp.]|jgi:hypothetical protein|nr:hypothetical protein [Methanobrevibacter sp.]
MNLKNVLIPCFVIIVLCVLLNGVSATRHVDYRNPVWDVLVLNDDNEVKYITFANMTYVAEPFQNITFQVATQKSTWLSFTHRGNNYTRNVTGDNIQLVLIGIEYKANGAVDFGYDSTTPW